MSDRAGMKFRIEGTHYKVREEGRYISKAIYTLLGLTVDGNKEILGERSKFCVRLI